MSDVVATEHDVAEAAAIIEAAFRADPVWSVALARPDGSTEHVRRVWELSVRGAAPYGMAHLAADLARWDAEGVPTYLESSNPANDRRYERAGYRRIGEFTTVIDAAVIGTYWRDADSQGSLVQE